MIEFSKARTRPSPVRAAGGPPSLEHSDFGFVCDSVLAIWCLPRRAAIHVVTVATILILLHSAARADQHIGDFCRIKGQEENTLHGMGLVVGLRGTGDGDNKA